MNIHEGKGYIHRSRLMQNVSILTLVRLDIFMSYALPHKAIFILLTCSLNKYFLNQSSALEFMFIICRQTTCMKIKNLIDHKVCCLVVIGTVRDIAGGTDLLNQVGYH